MTKSSGFLAWNLLRDALKSPSFNVSLPFSESLLHHEFYFSRSTISDTFQTHTESFDEKVKFNLINHVCNHRVIMQKNVEGLLIDRQLEERNHLSSHQREQKGTRIGTLTINSLVINSLGICWSVVSDTLIRKLRRRINYTQADVLGVKRLWDDRLWHDTSIGRYITKGDG